MRIIALLLAFLLALPLAAQQCVVSFSLTASGSSSVFNNLTKGCANWTITYNSTGFTGLTLTVQTAPNNGGSPGSWSTFTPASGNNPASATTQASATFAGYFPFLRVNLSGLTGAGTVSGLLYGEWTDYGGGGGGGGTVTAIGPDAPGVPSSANPVQVAGNDGTNVRAIRTDANGNPLVAGTAAAGSAPSGNPIAMGGTDGTNMQRLRVDTSGRIVLSSDSTSQTDDQPNTPSAIFAAGAAGSIIRAYPFFYDEPSNNWDRIRGNNQAGMQIAGRGSGSSGTIYPVLACDSSAVINVTAGATLEIVSTTGSRSVRVCAFSLSSDTASSTARWVHGTGANCATSTTNVTGAYSMGANTVIAYGSGVGELFKTVTGRNLCLVAATGNITGLLSYVVF